MASSVPNMVAVRVYSWGWALFYLVLYFFVRGVFPDKALADALYIEKVAASVVDGEATQGFAVMASLFSMIPFSFQLVGLLNAFILYKFAGTARTYRGMMLLPFLLFPLIITDMPAPVKETMVLILSGGLWYAATRISSEKKMFWLIVASYLLYGIGVRDYYLLIIAAFIFINIFVHTPVLARVLYFFPVLLFLILIPPEGFLQLGGARDFVNEQYVYGGAMGVRTFFVNPFPSDNGIHFLGNYLNAFVLLNFPFVREFTFKEILLFSNVLICGWLMIGGLRYFRGTFRLLPMLFLSHLFVLWLFEPDSGSYMRHTLSVLPYLLPVFLWYEERRFAGLLDLQNEEEMLAIDGVEEES